MAKELILSWCMYLGVGGNTVLEAVSVQESIIAGNGSLPITGTSEQVRGRGEREGHSLID